MDLLITKLNQVVKLSDLGFYNIAISESSPTLSLDKRTIRGRNGTIYDGLTYNMKEIVVSGRVAVESIQAYMQLEDDIKGLLLDSKPYFITKMRPKVENLYDFEQPGQRSGDLDLQNAEHVPWHYRHKVTAGKPSFSFIGKTAQGLKYDFSVLFVTAEMPFGETVPKDVTLNNGVIPYLGNATFSQLEYPYAVVLTASGGQNSFNLTIDGRRFSFSQASPIKSGTIITITGNGTTVKGSGASLATNATDKTNYEFFELKPNLAKQVSYSTNFNGSIVIRDFKEIYR